LLQVGIQEEAAAKRKVQLQAMELVDLKKLLRSKALEVGNKKEEMVATFLGYESQVCEAALAYGAKVDAAIAERKAELETKTFVELKELCASRDLKQGANKEACLERLTEDLKTNGEIDSALAGRARDARRQDLQSAAKDAALKRCVALEIDPLVKEVMVERVMNHESEFGRIDGPAAKKARKTK